MEPEEHECEDSGGELDDMEADEYATCSFQHNAAIDIFPVNKPPSKRVKTSKNAAPNQEKKSRHVHDAGAGGSSSTAVSVAVAPVAPVAAPQDSQINGDGTVKKSSIGERGTDLLDHRAMPDADELFSENEHALTNFIRLHPQLSLDATSDRTMSAAAALLGDCAVKTRELEQCSKTHDDKFLRAANEELGERPCVNDEKCICRWLAVFRFGEATNKAFVCREFLLPSQLRKFEDSGELPKTHSKCLLCSRYFMSYIYTLARNSPNFKPNGSIALQAFGNTIGVKDVESETLLYSNDVETEEGYSNNVMLYADERWADLASSRSEISTLMWRPVVRFKSSDYSFDTDRITKETTLVQINMSSNAYKKKNQDFSQPSSQPVAARRA